MRRREQRTHRLTLSAADDKHIWIECAAGDLSQHLGAEPTPDDVYRAADAHWGQPINPGVPL